MRASIENELKVEYRLILIFFLVRFHQNYYGAVACYSSSEVLTLPEEVINVGFY